MPPLQVNLKKISAAQSSLDCRRADGTVTWSRVHPFYPGHDLSHFAVETALNLRQGFFGPIAEGGELTGFIQKSVAAKLPVEAFWAECAVGSPNCSPNPRRWRSPRGRTPSTNPSPGKSSRPSGA